MAKGQECVIIDGVEMNKIMQLLCSKVCENIDPIDEMGEATTTANETVALSSSKTESTALQCVNCKDVISDIQEIKLDQESNRVAIQSLSDSVQHNNQVIAQLHENLSSITPHVWLRK